MDFATKFHPNTIDSFVGTQQRNVATTLQASVDTGTPIQKLLFLGNSGIGKTSLSLFYAQLLDAQIHHINCIENSGIDYVRDLVGRFAVGSLAHKYTIYMLDELHGWSGKAQEAILVPLENLPPHVIVLATSTEPQKLVSTLKSRFQVHHLQLPTEDELKRYMLRVFDTVGVSIDKTLTNDRVVIGDAIHISPQYARAVLNAANGNIRTLITQIEMVVAGTFENVTDTGNAASTNMVKTIYDACVTGAIRFDYSIADYAQITNGVAYWALRVLKSNPDDSAARKVFALFSKGLANNVPPEIAFYSLLNSPQVP